MRRPLAVIGFTGLLALVFAAFFGESMAFWAAAGIAVLSLVFLAVGIFCPRFRRYKAVLVACVAAVVFFSSYVLCMQLRVRPVQALDGQSAEIEGVVCELPYESYGKYYYLLYQCPAGGVLSQHPGVWLRHHYVHRKSAQRH